MAFRLVESDCYNCYEAVLIVLVYILSLAFITEIVDAAPHSTLSEVQTSTFKSHQSSSCVPFYIEEKCLV